MRTTSSVLAAALAFSFLDVMAAGLPVVDDFENGLPAGRDAIADDMK